MKTSHKRLEAECFDYIKMVSIRGEADNNGIFEAAMELIFGPDIWKVLNQYDGNKEDMAKELLRTKTNRDKKGK